MCFKVIAFDADDTLWENEHYFRHSEDLFCTLFAQYMPAPAVQQVLNETARANIRLYGFGIKSFMLSMIEAGLRISGGQLSSETIGQLIGMGKQMLEQPVALMEGIEEVLSNLQQRYKLIIATKGDLLDQERKLHKSGLAGYFHHIEIMSEKDESSYHKLVKQLGIEAADLLMIGNSLKSDILPVLNIGGHAIHIPYHITNIFEQAERPPAHPRFKHIDSVKDLLLHIV